LKQLKLGVMPMKKKVRWIGVLFFFLLAPAFADESQHVQILAASCAACHGTSGNSLGGTPVLAGLQREYFMNQMLAFKHGEQSSTVMRHHASGLQDSEIEALANYFAQLPRQANPEAPHTKFRGE
jgi:cytochrome subunit of sulfide dehydrogenase